MFCRYVIDVYEIVGLRYLQQQQRQRLFILTFISINRAALSAVNYLTFSVVHWVILLFCCIAYACNLYRCLYLYCICTVWNILHLWHFTVVSSRLCQMFRGVVLLNAAKLFYPQVIWNFFPNLLHWQFSLSYHIVIRFSKSHIPF